MPDPLEADVIELVENRTGMSFSRGRAEIAGRQIAARMRELGLERADYMLKLTSDAAELATLVETLGVRETYFFRHPQQFELLERRVLPGLAARAARTGVPLTLWSAGCSTGCEPYTLAIVCAQVAARLGPFPYRILATDISRLNLEAASTGLFSDREVRLKTSPNLIPVYFSREGGGSWRISDRLREVVSFLRVNLVTDVLPTGCRLVLCRNVLYYLSQEARETVLRRIWASLEPESLFMVAPTESAGDHGSYFRTVDLPQRLYECWRTSPAPPMAEGAPGNGPEGPIALVGTIARPIEVAGFLNRVSQAVRAGRSPAIDATALVSISNEALHELTRGLGAIGSHTFAAGIRIAHPVQSEWFETSGVTRWLGRPRLGDALAAPPPDRATAPSRDRPTASMARVFRIELPVQASGATLEVFRRRLESSIAEIAAGAGRGGTVELDAGRCVFLDDAHGLLVRRFHRSLPDGVALSVPGASEAVRRFLAGYLPPEALSSVRP